jgi:tRNA 2-selenouridine synthase
VERLVREYAAYSNDLLADAISRITKRLGGQNAKAALQALNMRDYETVADITLTYYDKAYLKGLANRDKQTIHTLKLESNDVTGNAEKLLEFYQENFIE